MVDSSHFWTNIMIARYVAFIQVLQNVSTLGEDTSFLRPETYMIWEAFFTETQNYDLFTVPIISQREFCVQSRILQK